MQLHIWQHLVQFVCTNPYEVSGDVRRYRWRRPGQFYVDPRTGLLREWRSEPRSRAAAPPREYVRVEDGRVCRRIDGLWYEVELRPLPRPPFDAAVYDVVLRRNGPFSRGELQDLYGGAVYAVKKRQMNKREIRRLATAGSGTAGGADRH